MLPNLKKLRDLHQISQKELANAINISQQSINKYENQNAQPDAEILKRMADYFNTSIDYILGYTDIPKKIGSAGSYSLDEYEAGLIERIRTLSSEEKQCIDLVVRTLSKK